MSRSETAVSRSETAVSRSETAVTRSETTVSRSETTVSRVTRLQSSYFPLLSVTRFTYGKFDSTCYGILHFGYDAADSLGIYSGGKPVYTLVSSKRRRAIVGAEGVGSFPKETRGADNCVGARTHSLARFAKPRDLHLLYN